MMDFDLTECSYNVWMNCFTYLHDMRSHKLDTESNYHRNNSKSKSYKYN